MTGLQLCSPELSQYVWNPPHMCHCAHASASSVSLMFSVSSSSDRGLQFSQQKRGSHLAQEWVKWKFLLKCEHPYKQSEQHVCELPRPVPWLREDTGEKAEVWGGGRKTGAGGENTREERGQWREREDNKGHSGKHAGTQDNHAFRVPRHAKLSLWWFFGMVLGGTAGRCFVGRRRMWMLWGPHPPTRPRGSTGLAPAEAALSLCSHWLWKCLFAYRLASPGFDYLSLFFLIG